MESRVLLLLSVVGGPCLVWTCRSCACFHSLSEFICVPFLLCLEDNVLLESSITSASYNLSASSCVASSLSLDGRGVMKTSHRNEHQPAFLHNQVLPAQRWTESIHIHYNSREYNTGWPQFFSWESLFPVMTRVVPTWQKLTSVLYIIAMIKNEILLNSKRERAEVPFCKPRT